MLKIERSLETTVLTNALYKQKMKIQDLPHLFENNASQVAFS